MKLNHQNLGVFSLEQKLNMVRYYSDISAKSALEGIDDVADTYDSNNLIRQDIHDVMGNMFQRQQMILLLDHITSVIGINHVESPSTVSLASETFLVDNLLGKLKEQCHVSDAAVMIFKYFPTEWKRLFHTSLNHDQQVAVNDEIHQALTLYLKFKAE